MLYTCRKLLLSIFSHRTLALMRWDLHFIRIRLSNTIFLKRRNLSKLSDDQIRPKFLNLGSGPRGVADSHWINVDGYQDTNVRYLMDFTRKWPFRDNAIDGIFCEHVFEHFDFEQGEAVLRECSRVLRPGGCIRIIVPDGEKIMRAYFDDPAELLKQRPGKTSCAIETINSYFRQ